MARVSSAPFLLGDGSLDFFREHADCMVDYQPEQTLRRIDQICDAFEEAWKTGISPRIEDFLSKFSGERSKLLIELLKLEISLRQEAGETPKRSDYASRFPNESDILDLVFGASIKDPTPQPNVSSTVLYPDSVQNPLQEPKTVPDRIGRYRIDEVLGEGGFGRVYRGYDESLKREVAIKVPRLDLLREPVDVAGYLGEAQTVASLEHPHIVPVYDIGSTADVPIYVVSKLVRGESLQDQLKKAPLTAQEVARLMVPIAEALHYAHQHGLIHRDVKPANILIDVQGQPLLTDFGLALHEEHQAQHKNEVSGSPAYMAPEQVDGKSHHLDGRTDIWALGVILYELLTGRRPFGTTTRSELFEEIRERDPKPPRMIEDSIPPELEQITLKCLAKKIPERYSTAGDLARELQSWLATTSLSEAGVPSSPSPSSRKGLAGVLALIVIGCAFALGFVFSNKSDLPTIDLAKSDVPESSPRENKSVSQALLEADVDVLIWNDKNPRRWDLQVDKHFDALPLEAGDKIRVEASVSRSSYLYLFWIDGGGKVLPLSPWKNFDWSQRGEETKRQSLSYPSGAGEYTQVEPGESISTVLLLARSTPFPEEHGLQDTLAQFPRLQEKLGKSSVSLNEGLDLRERNLLSGSTTTRHPVLRARQFLHDKFAQEPKMVFRAFAFESGISE